MEQIRNGGGVSLVQVSCREIQEKGTCSGKQNLSCPKYTAKAVFHDQATHVGVFY